MIVNQWVPAAHRGDAIGDSARHVRDLLRQLGHRSELYALSIDDDLSNDVRPFDDPEAKRGDLTIFHYALTSPMTVKFWLSTRRHSAAQGAAVRITANAPEMNAPIKGMYAVTNTTTAIVPASGTPRMTAARPTTIALNAAT